MRALQVVVEGHALFVVRRRMPVSIAQQELAEAHPPQLPRLPRLKSVKMMSLNPADWFRDAQQYLNEVGVEYRKITWPPQKEAMAGTIGVVVVVSIITVVLAVVDLGLSQLMQMVLG